MPVPELSVVIPIYNEEAAVDSVIEEWVVELDRLRIPFEICCYDDGSRDASLEHLKRWSERDTRVAANAHTNRGHGPTILRGYREAQGAWIFQTDGDGEMPAKAFSQLWDSRDGRNVVMARRVGRDSPLHRRILSGGARLAVRLLFGRTPTDANVPYRLMRGSWLRPQLERIPIDCAVPNVILSGLAAREGNVAELDVPFRPRTSGASSLNLRRIIRLAVRAVIDAAAVARKVRTR